jgi:hypothetical protein
MNKSDLDIGDVVCLRGSKAPLVVESLGMVPDEDCMAKVVWLDFDGHVQREVFDSLLLDAWTPTAEKTDHFPEVMKLLGEAMKRVGREPPPGEAFEVDHRGAPQQDAPPFPPQCPWTSDVPSDNT